MRHPQDLIFQLALAAQKIEKIKETAKYWRVHGIDSDGLVPIEVLSIESKTEDVLKKMKEVFVLIDRIRQTRGEIPMHLDDD
jgi:hypothetical protein